ncbi:hypothetical protein GIB67_014049 [Kingdonia uniflora]|uniref:Myb/SANT-like domain-containing protein n=1 Tax=Kingdonia uniflora TaxID=39325 RepID=A0A7J7KXA7_9MAGN|nr:hypothetical protein GIB67_014049 [Kingdonia uniflora]
MHLLWEIDMSKEVCRGKGAQKKNRGTKKAILKWNAAMDTGLIEALVEGRRLGLKENNIWEDKVWTMVQKVVQEKAFIQVERSHIDNRYRSLRKEYIAFDLVKLNNEIGWDPSKKTVTTSDKAWKILLEDPKNFDEFNRFVMRGQSGALNHYKLYLVKIMLHGMESSPGFAPDDIGGDDTLEANSASMATSLASKRPQVHGKKAKNDDKVNQVLYSLHSSLEDMKNSIDPIKRASNIREVVMKVESYSEHFLHNAWYIMMHDPVELKLFMAGDAKDKKMVLEGYRNRIYE